MREVRYYEYGKPVLLKSSFEDIRNEFHDEKILLLFSPTKFINVKEDITNSQFYTFSYVCIESNQWNERKT